MTVVRDENNEAHAILTVKTNGGEFILDNLRRRAGQPRRLSSRQAPEPAGPNVW